MGFNTKAGLMLLREPGVEFLHHRNTFTGLLTGDQLQVHQRNALVKLLANCRYDCCIIGWESAQNEMTSRTMGTDRLR